MNVDIGTEFLFWEYLFCISSIVSLKCASVTSSVTDPNISICRQIAALRHPNFSDSEKKKVTRVCLASSWPVTAAGGHATTERQLTCLCRLLIAHKLRKNWAPPDQALSVDPSASVDPDFHG